MAVTLSILPQSAPGTVSYTTSGNDITMTYNPGASTYRLDYWKVKNYGYQFLEYIQSDGSAYINLDNYCYNGDYDRKHVMLEMDCELLAAPTKETYLYGSVDGNNCSYFRLSVQKTTARLKGLHPSNASPTERYNLTPGERHNIKHYAGCVSHRWWNVVELDNSIRDDIYTGLGNMVDSAITNCWDRSKEIYLFAYNNNGSATLGTAMKLYNFRLELYPDKNNVTTIIDLKPAKRAGDGAIGLYDINTGKFYTNAGSGSFTAGPVIQSYTEGLIKGDNPATTYYASSANIIAQACVYDYTRFAGYVEYDYGSAETSSQCLLHQKLTKSNKLDLESQTLFRGTTNGGVSWDGVGGYPEAAENHVFFAKQDGYIICSEEFTEDGDSGSTTVSIIINGERKLYQVMNNSSSPKYAISNFYSFKKGDLVIWAGASNYTDGSAVCCIFYL